MKRGSLFLLIVVLILALLVAAGISILHDGLIARAARKMAAPSNAHNQKNPIADSPDVQREARLHFADHCAICHGNDGSGDTMLGRGLYPKPPDLRARETQELSDGDIFWIIENGVRLTGMAAFGGMDSDHDSSEQAGADSWKLVRFIRHLPALTPEEKIEMEKYNPKGPEDREEEQEENDFLNGTSAKPPSKSEPHHH